MEMMSYEEMTIAETNLYKAYEQTLAHCYGTYHVKDFEHYLCESSSCESYSAYYSCYLAAV